ncbi:hypothetical protein QTP70_012675 [Hemibagrus guttatus]|uniref:Uncharacterized protein n=1 Tax=Hemibagrus guttatus TaxID=175788 RepID=A0AAE0QDS3_9TELE|nr:hypothetical protein QTP70_012675 [Hemibagrus guttatus]
MRKSSVQSLVPLKVPSSSSSSSSSPLPYIVVLLLLAAPALTSSLPTP